MSIDLVWAALRSTRADAPAGIKGGRRRTYVAALEAAARHVGNSDYPLVGHGIKADTSTLVGPITGVQVHADGSAAGSFTRLSGILNSPTWNSTNPVALGELWNSLPGGIAMSLDGTIGAPRCRCPPARSTSWPKRQPTNRSGSL